MRWIGLAERTKYQMGWIVSAKWEASEDEIGAVNVGRDEAADETQPDGIQLAG